MMTVRTQPVRSTVRKVARTLAFGSALTLATTLAVTAPFTGPTPASAINPVAGNPTDVFYALDVENAITGDGPDTPSNPDQAGSVTIRQMSVDNTTQTIHPSNTIMGAPIDIALTPELTTGAQLQPNALGVSNNGTFYFTVQRTATSPAEGGGVKQSFETVDVYEYAMTQMPSNEHPNGIAAAPRKVVENYRLNSRVSGSVNGGAVHPIDGAYYFMYYSHFTGAPGASHGGAIDPANWDQYVRAHIYRYDPTQPANPTAVMSKDQNPMEITHVDILKNEDTRDMRTLMDGDMVFDAAGNLTLTGSLASLNPETEGAPSFTAFVNADRLEASRQTVLNQQDKLTDDIIPTIIPNSANGGAAQPLLRAPMIDLNNGVGPAAPHAAVFNGIAFTGSGALITTQTHTALPYSVHAMNNPLTLNTLNGAAPTRSEMITGTFVDLASNTTPSTVTVRPSLNGERFHPDDQFSVTAEHVTDAGTTPFATTTSVGAATGVQVQQVGPQPVVATGTVNVIGAPTAHATHYAQSFNCTVRNAQGTEVALPLTVDPANTHASFVYANAIALGTPTPAVTCTVAFDRLAPALVPALTADPAAGTNVADGELINYRVTLSNTAGNAAAHDLNFVNDLTGVLAHAEFVPGSLRYGDGTEPGYPEPGTVATTVTAAGPTDNTLTITGSVPSGETRTVWYSVRVQATAPAALQNLLRDVRLATQGQCDTAGVLCTSHPVVTAGSPEAPGLPDAAATTPAAADALSQTGGSPAGPVLIAGAALLAAAAGVLLMRRRGDAR